MRHIMLDIETLGTKPGCVILAIAAKTFNPFNNPQMPESQFSYSISIFDQLMLGLIIDPETVEWWKSQSVEAQNSTYSGHENIKKTLIAFNDFVISAIGSSEQFTIWAKSPSFDCAIMEHAYHLCGIKPIWTFRDTADVRTITALAPRRDNEPPAPPMALVHHNALDDCAWQINEVQTALRRLKGTQ